MIEGIVLHFTTAELTELLSQRLQRKEAQIPTLQAAIEVQQSLEATEDAAAQTFSHSYSVNRKSEDLRRRLDDTKDTCAMLKFYIKYLPQNETFRLNEDDLRPFGVKGIY